jgi:hypothetical protein
MQSSIFATSCILLAAISAQLANNDELWVGVRGKNYTQRSISKPPCDHSESEMTSQVAYRLGVGRSAPNPRPHSRPNYGTIIYARPPYMVLTRPIRPLATFCAATRCRELNETDIAATTRAHEPMPCDDRWSIITHSRGKLTCAPLRTAASDVVLPCAQTLTGTVAFYETVLSHRDKQKSLLRVALLRSIVLTMVHAENNWHRRTSHSRRRGVNAARLNVKRVAPNCSRCCPQRKGGAWSTALEARASDSTGTPRGRYLHLARMY